MTSKLPSGIWPGLTVTQALTLIPQKLASELIGTDYRSGRRVKGGAALRLLRPLGLLDHLYSHYYLNQHTFSGTFHDLKSSLISDCRAGYLSGANLQGADLYKANLSAATLRRASLSSADLGAADLRWANLRLANLSKATLDQADLRLADLSGTSLRGVKRIETAKRNGTDDSNESRSIKIRHKIGVSYQSLKFPFVAVRKFQERPAPLLNICRSPDYARSETD